MSKRVSHRAAASPYPGPRTQEQGLLAFSLNPSLRRRLGFLVIIVGLLILAPRFFKHEVEVSFTLPPQAKRLRLEVLREDAVYRGVEVTLDPGQSRHRETLQLPSGAYRIEATLETGAGPQVQELSVQLPDDSPVQIRF